jgi:hypothetical protein
MGDPELRSDEKVLVRTQGVYVKSIPFEGILTNKRIILIDRAKNLLPTKEIPLVTIKEVESGENAIRDQIITLSVMAKTGETRQMILTFSRQAGGNRIKERDAWARIIKENASSSFDQVIRKVIPSPEPAPRRAEPAAGPKYEIVHPPPQQTAPSRDIRPAGTETGGMIPVRRPVTTIPVQAVPPSPVVRQVDAPAPGTNIFCPKCGNRVPSGSVFCNRCGSPIAQHPPVSVPVKTPEAPPVVKTPPVSVPVKTPEAPPVVKTPEAPPVVKTPPVSAPVKTPEAPPVVQTPEVPPVVKPPAARPLDEEIQSIEPLIERSTVKIPADALRRAPAESPLKKSLSWDDEEKPGTPSVPEPAAPAEKLSEKGFIPQIFSAKPTTAPAPAPAPSYESPDDTPPPPKPPKGRSFMPGKKTLITAAVALVIIVLVAAGALFVYPMLTSGGLTLPSGQGGVTPTPTSTSSVLKPIGTPIVKETPPPSIPATGVYVHVDYLGGFKGSYGITDAITTVPGNSGNRVWEVENANGTVQATFEKLDGSAHEILVEIYKDGKLLTRGTTTVGHGSVALSVNTVTGIAAEPVTSGSGSPAKTATAAVVGTTAAAQTTTPAT